jgi:hypothetical protein
MDNTKENALLEQGGLLQAQTDKFYPTFLNAEQIAENGYQPIPTRPNEKIPSISNWQNFEYSANDPKNLYYKNHGIGLLTAYTPAIDIDCYSEEIAEEL